MKKILLAVCATMLLAACQSQTTAPEPQTDAVMEDTTIAPETGDTMMQDGDTTTDDTMPMEEAPADDTMVEPEY